MAMFTSSSAVGRSMKAVAYHAFDAVADDLILTPDLRLHFAITSLNFPTPPQSPRIALNTTRSSRKTLTNRTSPTTIGNMSLSPPLKVAV